ncbi:ankyrin repeat domain-containing protein [Wolbachia endosymbiont (group A) of Myopa testacea]|uniref:ankyrin repeat domain-containing protein n=2 Tax=Wolbachia endosymbiont (group A) of Myopa testacea TaxID=3066148 RepID=UPI003132A627
MVKFDMTYEEIKEIVTQNPDITAEEFGEKLKQSGTTDTKICDLFMDIIRSTLNDRNTFLKAVELLAKSNIKIDIGDTVSKTVLDYAVVCGQPDVIKIFLESGKFDQKRKLNAFSLAINGEKVQEFEVFLDYIDHAAILDALNIASCNERTNIMKVLSDNKIFTEQEKVDALSNACIDSDLPKVRLLLKHMTGIPEDGIRNILKIIKESKSPFEEELRTGSEFKVDFSNSDHCTYLSNRVIIALLRSAINKKEERNTPDAGKNGAGFSSSNISTDQTTTLNNVEDLCEKIDKNIKLAIRYDNGIADLEGLQKRLKREINFQDKCEQGAVLGNALLEHAIKNERLNTIKFLLQNGVTIISAIGQEGRCYVSKIEEDKSILCSVVHYTDNSNAEILSTLLRNINAEQSKLNHEDELYILYQQLKDDAFCTAIAENNSVAATVLIQNDQETRASAVNKDETPVVTGTEQVITTPSVEENRTEPNKNVSNKPTATVPPILTKKTNPTTVPNSGNGRSVSNKPVSPVVSTNAGTPAMSSGNDKSSNLTNAQFSVPNEKEAKYKESKENFYTSLTKDAVGVVITGLFIAAAVMVPFAAGAAICGIVAALVAVCTGLHIKNSTLPSYREMEENKVEHVSSYMQKV